MSDIFINLAMNTPQGVSLRKVFEIGVLNEKYEPLYALEPSFADDINNGVCVCDIHSGTKNLLLSRKLFPIKRFRFHAGTLLRNEVVVTDEVHALIFNYLKTIVWKPRDNRPHLVKWDMTFGTDDWLSKWK